MTRALCSSVSRTFNGAHEKGVVAFLRPLRYATETSGVQ